MISVVPCSSSAAVLVVVLRGLEGRFRLTKRLADMLGFVSPLAIVCIFR